MTNPTRVTVAFDKPTAELLEKISTEGDVSQSEIMRRALKFYAENKALDDPINKRKIHSYLDMLLSAKPSSAHFWGNLFASPSHPK